MFTECGLYMLDNIYYALSIHVTTTLNNVVCLFLSQHFLNVVEECFEYVLTTFIECCVIHFFFFNYILLMATYRPLFYFIFLGRRRLVSMFI
jgi:hypothetical protein